MRIASSIIVFQPMGQSLLSDEECVIWLREALLALGEKLEGTPSSLWTPTGSIQGRSFRATVYLYSDYEKDSGLCVQLRLRKRGPGRHRDRYIYFRREKSGRRLRHARTWRALGGRIESRKASSHRKLSLIRLSRDIFGFHRFRQMICAHS